MNTRDNIAFKYMDNATLLSTALQAAEAYGKVDSIYDYTPEAYRRYVLIIKELYWRLYTSGWIGEVQVEHIEEDKQYA